MINIRICTFDFYTFFIINVFHYITQKKCLKFEFSNSYIRYAVFKLYSSTHLTHYLYLKIKCETFEKLALL